MKRHTSFTRFNTIYRNSLVVLLFGITLAGMKTSASAAVIQEAKTETKAVESTAVPRVSLGEITGSPGASLMVPLYYTPDPKMPLKSLSVDIEFVSNSLKFQKVARGVIPDDIQADITSTVTEGEKDAKGIARSKLHVNVALADKNTKNGLPEGLLAFLLYQVSMEAKPFSIKLTPEVVASEQLQASKQVAKVTAVPGTVVVEIEDLLPEATCFFFNH